MFSTCVGVIHTSASIILVARNLYKQCYFSLILHIFTGAVGKKKNIYTLQRHFKTWCLVLSMIDMYRSLALLCI